MTESTHDTTAMPTRKLRVLEIHYSQTGQLTRVMDRVLQPLLDAPQVTVVRHRIQPSPAYPFPWPFFRFFDQFPETVGLVAPEIEPVTVDGSFDLIVLGYTPWYLTPAPPIVSLLQSPAGQALFANTPVVTVTACRNMWLMAQQRLNKLIRSAGGEVVDRLVFADQGGTAATFVTVPRWMLTGKKNAFMGVFPPAGVAEQEIEDASRYGREIHDWLVQRGAASAPATGDGASGVFSDPPNPPDARLLPSEFMGLRSFMIWGAIIRAVGRQGRWTRKPIIGFYAIFLAFAIVTVVPLTVVLMWLFRLVPAFRRYHDNLAQRVVA